MKINIGIEKAAKERERKKTQLETFGELS